MVEDTWLSKTGELLRVWAQVAHPPSSTPIYLPTQTLTIFVIHSSVLSSDYAIYSSSDDESEEEEAETENDGVDECEKYFYDDESSDEDTIAEPVQFKESPIAVQLNYVPGEYGQGKVIKTYFPESLYPIPYPVFYRYRGEAMKRLNRLEYYSLVHVKRREKESDLAELRGRPTSKEFPFGRGLNEQIGGAGAGRYFQYMRSKQCTPLFFSSPPSHPGRRPLDPEKQKAWRMKADKFACDFLIMFRPEPDLYEEGQSCTYEYNWEAFLEFVQELQMSNKDVDRSRLDQMERMVHSWGVNEGKREVLTEWRGRCRTMWSAEDKKLASAEYAKFKKGKFGNEGDNNVDYSGIGVPSEQLTLRQNTDVLKMISHSNELLSELNQLHNVPRDQEHSTRGPFEPVRTTKFDEELANSLAKLQPKDENSGGSTDSIHWKVPGSVEAKVETYLKDEDLSSDKTPVIEVMREHYRAVHEGRSQAAGYNAPLLLVCGGPGNGKSKLVESLDGISSLMNVGAQVKTAYLGVAAVNIGGSSLMSLFDIPTERRKGGGDFKKMILPWSDEKKRKFMQTYDINKISCIVLDEISTLQSYIFAYLSARLMELLPESGKDFGGLAVILCGDFDQLPPVAGDSLAAATMKYEELQGSRSNNNITRWDPSKHCVNVHNEGIRLFRKAICFQLTQQHRSKDPVHTEIINKMRRSGKVDLDDLKNKCKLLKKEDVEGDGDFRFATTLVTGNEERHKINHLKAKDWVSHRNTCLVRWLREVNYRDWKGKPRSEEYIKHAMSTNESFYEQFVQGARGFLNHNINTSIGLANGTEIKYDSISFNYQDDEKEYRKHLNNHSPGETITLDKPPSAINVELFADFPGDSEAQKKKNAKKRKSWQHESLASDGRIVIPISRKYASYNDWEKTCIPAAYKTSSRCETSGLRRSFSWRPLYGASKVPLKDCFCIEPGFCITVYKAQGRTIRRLILSISDHPHHKLRHKWEGLYVGLSRVEYNKHMRILLKRGDWGTAKSLHSLEKCKHTDWFFKGYKRQPRQSGTTWDRRLARAAAGLDDGKKKKTAKETRKSKKRKKKTSPIISGVHPRTIEVGR